MESANEDIYTQKETQCGNGYTSEPHINSRFPKDMKLGSIKVMLICEILIPAVMPLNTSIFVKTRTT
jgi:hypothetical protein